MEHSTGVIVEPGTRDVEVREGEVLLFVWWSQMAGYLCLLN